MHTSTPHYREARSGIAPLQGGTNQYPTTGRRGVGSPAEESLCEESGESVGEPPVRSSLSAAPAGRVSVLLH